MKRIAFDIDGVLADFISTVSYVASSYFGLKITTATYDMGITRKQFHCIHNWMLDNDMFLDIPVYDGAVRTLQALDSLGYDIWYITKRYPVIMNSDRVANLRYQTLLWLVFNKFPQAKNLVFSYNTSKENACLKRGIPSLVEDHFETAKTSPRIKVYLLDKPYNQGDHSPRIKTLQEVISLEETQETSQEEEKG